VEISAACTEFTKSCEEKDFTHCLLWLKRTWWWVVVLALLPLQLADTFDVVQADRLARFIL